jgi:hypothetical protein
MSKFFRKVKDQTIEYSCGCIIEITVRKNATGSFDAAVTTFCIEHDPSLTEYAKEHEDDIAEAFE